jgi:succinate dehydrogenase/fumarate reductase cytochrome b subunit
MKKLILFLFILFVVFNGYSDSTQTNLKLSEPPPAGTKQIIIGSGLYVASAVGLVAIIYLYNDWKKPQVGWCGTGKAMEETDMMSIGLACIACTVAGTIIIHRGIKKRRIYLEWKLGQNYK